MKENAPTKPEVLDIRLKVSKLELGDLLKYLNQQKDLENIDNHLLSIEMPSLFSKILGEDTEEQDTDLNMSVQNTKELLRWLEQDRYDKVGRIYYDLKRAVNGGSLF